jgi:hypothetical protein
MRRLALLLALATACDSPTIPGRDGSDIYPFDLPTQPPQTLRWPSGQAIRVFAVPGRQDASSEALRNAVDRGAAAWNEQAVFAEFHIERTTDLAAADVIVAWSDVTLPVNTENCRPVLAQAVTTFCVGTTGADSAHLRVFPRPAGEASRIKMVVLVLATELAIADRLVAHELGHVLGIGRHSPDARDLMYRSDQPVSRPTRRDAATVQVLYHTRADIVP